MEDSEDFTHKFTSNGLCIEFVKSRVLNEKNKMDNHKNAPHRNKTFSLQDQEGGTSSMVQNQGTRAEGNETSTQT